MKYSLILILFIALFFNDHGWSQTTDLDIPLEVSTILPGANGLSIQSNSGLLYIEPDADIRLLRNTSTKPAGIRFNKTLTSTNANLEIEPFGSNPGDVIFNMSVNWGNGGGLTNSSRPTYISRIDTRSHVQGFVWIYGSTPATTGQIMKLQPNGDLLIDGSLAEEVSSVTSTTNKSSVDALSLISRLQMIQYDEEKTQSRYSDRSMGFLPKELIKVVPSAVVTSDDGRQGIRYSQITTLNVKALQEQQDQIEELKAMISELKEKIV